MLLGRPVPGTGRPDRGGPPEVRTGGDEGPDAAVFVPLRPGIPVHGRLMP